MSYRIDFSKDIDLNVCKKVERTVWVDIYDIIEVVVTQRNIFIKEAIETSCNNNLSLHLEEIYLTNFSDT